MVLVQMKSCDRAQIGAFTLAVGVDIERLVAHQSRFWSSSQHSPLCNHALAMNSCNTIPWFCAKPEAELKETYYFLDSGGMPGGEPQTAQIECHSIRTFATLTPTFSRWQEHI